MKNTHKTQFVDLNRLYDGLEYLIEHHPDYKNSSIDQDFISRCRSQDPAGHDFLLEGMTL